MAIRYADPFDALFAFQRALDSRLASDWEAPPLALEATHPSMFSSKGKTWWQSSRYPVLRRES